MITVPEKGNIVWIDFNPQSGREQSGHRPAIVISPKIYHEKCKLAVLCPITSNVSPWPWKVMLPEGSVVGGAVLVDQLKSVDRDSRHMKIVGSTTQEVMDEILDKVSLLIS